MKGNQPENNHMGIEYLLVQLGHTIDVIARPKVASVHVPVALTFNLVSSCPLTYESQRPTEDLMFVKYF